MKKYALIMGGIGTLLAMSGTAYAYQGDPTVQGPYYSPERHAAIENALEEKDYTAWKELMGDRPITQKITEQNFEKFVQIHQLMEEGKTEEARQLRAELGIGQGLQNKSHALAKKGFKRGYQTCTQNQ